MKCLNATGEYINKKQAQPIMVEQESHLWDLGLLGDHNPQTLLNTIVFQVGLFLGVGMNVDVQDIFPRRSSFMSLQETVHTWCIERIPPNQTREGFLAKKKKPKEVYQYAVEKDPSRCFVQLYKLYNSKCPENRPSNAFYLTPLANPKQDVWYSRTLWVTIHSVKSWVKWWKKLWFGGGTSLIILRESHQQRGCLMHKLRNS